MRYITEFNPEFETRPLSYSSLKAFQKSPQHFVEYRLTKKEPTPALIFGNLLDVMILTPEEYERKYAIMPHDIKKPTSAQVNAAKPSEASVIQIQRYNEWCDANRGKTWIDQDDKNLADFLAKKTFDNAKAKDILDRVASTQQKMSWTHKATNLPLIGYKDMQGDTFIGDLKSSADGSPEVFMKSAFQFGYHIQTGAYLDFEKTMFGRFPDYYFLVVETTAPYNISVYKATKEFIELGTQQFNELMMAVKYCAEENLWYQGYEFHSPTGYHQLDLPGWAKQKLTK
jgi:exodeoxyribonuclease VIII